MALTFDKTSLSNDIATALQSHFDKTTMVSDLLTLFSTPADPKRTPTQQADDLAQIIDDFVKSGASQRASDIADAVEAYVSPLETHLHSYTDTPVGPSTTGDPIGPP